MFVSPVLDGWTLVFGTPKSMIRKHDETSIEDEHVAQQRRCVELSRQFGTVYWYVQVENGGCGDWMGWCSAEQESLIRYYHHDFHEGEVEAGEPLAAEAGLRTPDGSGLLGRIQQHLPQEQAMYLLLTMPEYDPDAEGENSSQEALAALGEWREEVRATLRTWVLNYCRVEAPPSSPSVRPSGSVNSGPTPRSRATESWG